MQRVRRVMRNEWFLLLAVTVLAASLRLYALDRLPPGLYHDEAHNGLDALEVIAGAHPIFFETNNGREPLFIYLVSLSVSFLGRSPLAVRLVAALLGTLTVPATYFMAREMLGQRIALLAAVVTTTTFWHLNLSRIGFRAVALPLLTALYLWLFVRGLHSKRVVDFALGGFFLGLGLYCYLPARFAPLPFVLLILYYRCRRQPINWRGLLAFFAVALMVASPLLLYAVRHADTFLARSAQVSIFNPTIKQGNLVGTFLQHAGRTLGMFNWRGDFIPRHNLPYRPVFDPVMGLLFLLGLIVSLRRAPRQQEYALLLLYSAAMLLPTILAEGAPHFLRAVGILPAVFVFPAVGWEVARSVLRRRTSSQATSLVAAVLLGASLLATVNDYFLQHAPSEATYYNFETGAVELAADINRFIAMGWTPESGWRVPRREPNPLRVVYLDTRLWHDWASLHYLVPTAPNLLLTGEDASPPATGQQVRIIVWPYQEHGQYLNLLPREALISALEGPLERGDLEEQARLLCVTYEAGPRGDIPFHIGARFEHEIQLLGYQLRSEAEGTRVRLFWQVDRRVDSDYTVFVHWMRDQRRIAQSDSYPAQGYYPTSLWRVGDVVADDHLLPVTVTTADSITVGLYQWQTMERLRVLDRSGAAVADAVTITFP